ncbi:hypothetical protein HPB51_009043 [Rhipicephalus microplus]|uniref:Uncharacterized protein n=1 Tax=Rhipicephalus microplus TaxID=6941 RepID=A0A9J6D903_RHIMP|nr:hypothetical protein HPB51_009043 [Rhipicephalus microplus]
MENSTAGFIKPSSTEAAPPAHSKPEGERQLRPFSASFAKVAPGRTVFVVANTKDIPVHNPLGDRLQRAVQLRAPAVRLDLVGEGIGLLSGCVVLAKNSTDESFFACTAKCSTKFPTAGGADTMDFQKTELCEDGHVLGEDPTSRRLIFERLLVLTQSISGKTPEPVLAKRSASLNGCILIPHILTMHRIESTARHGL